MNRLISFTSLFLLSLAPVVAQTRRTIQPIVREGFEKQQKIAVIVSVGRYESLSPLKYTLADAQELGQELERQGYDVLKLINNEATSDMVRTKLREKASVMDPNQGTILFIFTGHGFQNAEHQNYLATYGVNMNNLDKEGLAVSEVEKMLNATGATRRMIWIDACRNAPDQKAVAEPRSFASFQKSEGIGILYSTRAGSFSYEDSTLQHGLFSYFLLEGLRGKAAGPDGFVTFMDLASYVETNVYDYAKKKDWIQKPFKAGEFSGDFLLATAGKAPVEPAKPKTEMSNDVMLLRASGSNEPYWADFKGESLVLYKGKDMTTYAVLSKQADTSSGPLYAGQAGSVDIEAVVQAVNGNIKMINGRVGPRCEANDPCQGPSVRLPHEGESLAQRSKEASSKTSTTAKIVGEFGRGRWKQVMQEADRTSTRVGINLSQAVRNSHRWQPFNLAASVAPAK